MSRKAASNISKYFKVLRHRGIIKIVLEGRGKGKRFDLTKQYAPLRLLKASEDKVRDRQIKEVRQLKLLDLK